MWNFVGIVRSGAHLERASNRIARLRRDVDALYAASRITRDLIELRNLVQVADLIVQSAQARQESRGLHYRIDHPALAPTAEPTLLAPASA